MYANELSAKMIEDKRRSMRTSAFIHALIILLALLPFLKSPMPPKPYQQAILVEFDMGGSSEGSKQAAPNSPEDAMASATSDNVEEEVTEEEARDEVSEIKPVESTPSPSVLTSKVEPPVINQTKVRKVDVKTTPKPTNTIPKQTKIEEVPTKKKEVVLKPSKSRKVIVKVERPAVKKGKGSGSGKVDNSSKKTGSGTGKGKATIGGKGSGGDGSSKTGDGNGDGQGAGDKGDGDGTEGNGKGKGQGDGEGDGILTRMLLETPNFDGIIKESGRISINVCVDRNGKVTFVEFNREHSTIRDMDVIKKAVSYAREYLFERDLTAPARECGRVSFTITIED